MKKPHKHPKQDNPKARAAQLQREWEEMLARHSKPLERGAKALGIKGSPKVKKAPRKTEVVANRVPSNPNSMMGLATKAAPKVYTGTKIIGIGVLHKSNSVPIFSHEDAIDIARMRR